MQYHRGIEIDWKTGKKDGKPVYQSYHRGIEISYLNNLVLLITTINRTIVELK